MLKEFLHSAKNKLRHSSITICIGSEACDPDSLISSIVIAMHEQAIPVVNMSRNVFESKGDIQTLCKAFGIENEDLIFLERPKGSFTLSARILGSQFKTEKDSYGLGEKDITLILVDHHTPVEELRHCKIEMIIDHHSLGEASLAAKRIYMDTHAGSCCTLVSRFIGHSLSSHKHSKIEKEEKKEIAHMLMIPILFDTNRFKKVTTHFDKGEFRKLSKITGKKKEAKALVKEMRKNRHNDKDQSNETILLKDYKRFDKAGVVFGYSTVKFPYEKWIEREQGDFERMLNNFRREQGLDFMLVNRKKKGDRFLILVNFPFERKLVEEERMKLIEFEGVKYYWISPEKSRKVMVPIIKGMIHK